MKLSFLVIVLTCFLLAPTLTFAASLNVNGSTELTLFNLRIGHAVNNLKLQAVAQQFNITTATNYYSLESVEMRLDVGSFMASNTVQVNVYPVNSTGQPVGPSLGYATLPQTGHSTTCVNNTRTTFDFKPDIVLNSSAMYAYVFSHNGTGTQAVRVCYNGSSTYSGYIAYIKQDGIARWENLSTYAGSNSDLDFQLNYSTFSGSFNRTLLDADVEISLDDNFTDQGAWAISRATPTAQRGNTTALLVASSLISQNLTSLAVNTASCDAVYVNWYNQDDDLDAGDTGVFFVTDTGTYTEFAEPDQGTEDAWVLFSNSTTSSTYKHNNFSVRFTNPAAIAATENWWIDNVTILCQLTAPAIASTYSDSLFYGLGLW